MARYLRVLAVCLISVSILGFYCSFYVYPAGFVTRVQLGNQAQASASPLADLTLGVMSEIYVVSLPQRTERRQEMERLRKYLGLRWAYFPATSNDSSVIHAIMQRVKMLREECENNETNCNFAWSGNLNSSASSMRPLNLWSSDFLTPASLQLLAETWLSNPVRPLTCATKDFYIPKYDPKLPLNRLLTPARVACWHSHLSVIQLISNEEGLDPWSSVLVLEDDVDMESDIKSQLRNLWPLLPPDWDIVFLGEPLYHCDRLMIHHHDRSLLVRRIKIEAFDWSQSRTMEFDQIDALPITRPEMHTCVCAYQNGCPATSFTPPIYSIRLLPAYRPSYSVVDRKRKTEKLLGSSQHRCTEKSRSK